MSKREKTIENVAFNCAKVENITVPGVVDCKGNGKFVKYGNDNKLPNYLYDCFLNVSNLQSIILTYKDYICGKNIDSNYLYTNSEFENIKDVVKKCVEDWCIFGSFAIECIRNAKGDVCNILYQDVRNVRVNEDFTVAYMSNEWGSFQGKNTAELPLWDRNTKQPHFIYYYNGGARGWYGIPFYFAALKSIEILKRTRDFHLHNLENNFSANAIITFCNGVPSKSVQEEIFDKINNQFCGSENASKLFINFADNKDAAPQIQRLESDKFGDLYKSLQDSSVEDIYQACRINKMLLGANIQTGFNKQEWDECAKLFQTTTISPIQDDLEKAFENIGVKIKFEKFEFGNE